MRSSACALWLVAAFASFSTVACGGGDGEGSNGDGSGATGGASTGGASTGGGGATTGGAAATGGTGTADGGTGGSATGGGSGNSGHLTPPTDIDLGALAGHLDEAEVRCDPDYFQVEGDIAGDTISQGAGMKEGTSVTSDGLETVTLQSNFIPLWVSVTFAAPAVDGASVAVAGIIGVIDGNTYCFEGAARPRKIIDGVTYYPVTAQKLFETDDSGACLETQVTGPLWLCASAP